MSAAAAARLAVAALPAWIDHAEYELHPAQGDVQDGLSVLLRDTQVSLVDEDVATCIRVAYRIVTQAGAERGAQFSAVFDPALQRLDVHYIRVIREGAVVEHAAEGAFDLMRREQNLERRVLDGRLTATLIIPDVRPGDLVESCWTIHGGTPVLRNLFSDWIAMNGPVPDIRYRLRAPADRTIAAQTHDLTPDQQSSEDGGVRDQRWRVRNAPAYEFEALTPPWQVLAPSIQISEAQDWAQVSQLLERHYRCEGAHAEMIAAADAIRAEHPQDAAACMLAALALVREKLRYLSLSLGDGGIVPRPLAQIWATGYGDCKDAACVFVALCRMLDIDAACALVATHYGPVLNQWLPSPSVFDHCIARVRLDGKTWWVDPTRRARETTLDQMTNPHLGWALPLQPQDARLEEMPVAERKQLLDKFEKLSFARKISDPATLTLRIRYFSYHADWMRNAIANQGMESVSQHFLKRYREQWPGTAESQALSVQDDAQSGELCVSAQYTIADVWTEKSDTRVATAINEPEIADALVLLRSHEKRRGEVYLGLPRSLKSRLEIEMPVNCGPTGDAQDLFIIGAKYVTTLVAPEDRQLLHEQELTITAPVCAPDQAGGYADIARAIKERSGLTIRMPCKRGKLAGGSRKSGNWLSWWWVAWLGFMVLSTLLRMAGQH